jgi:filamin
MPIRATANTANATTSEHLKVEVHGRGSYEAKVNEEAEFTIDASKASTHGTGMPIVRLTGVQSDVEVRIRQVENNVFLCTYIPTAPGAYLLSVTWTERQIRGSPFKVNVSPNTNTNINQSASRVICSGDGLRMGILGKEIKCSIDTRGAGPGELTAYCQGTNKTAFCRLFDHRDGTFTLFIKPQESGKHILTIKYNDDDVPGSPYTLKVSGPPDASE